jgi:hypothetical protein
MKEIITRTAVSGHVVWIVWMTAVASVMVFSKKLYFASVAPSTTFKAATPEFVIYMNRHSVYNVSAAV